MEYEKALEQIVIYIFTFLPENEQQKVKEFLKNASRTVMNYVTVDLYHTKNIQKKLSLVNTLIPESSLKKNTTVDSIEYKEVHEKSDKQDIIKLEPRKIPVLELEKQIDPRDFTDTQRNDKKKKENQLQKFHSIIESKHEKNCRDQESSYFEFISETQKKKIPLPLVVLVPHPPSNPQDTNRTSLSSTKLAGYNVITIYIVTTSEQIISPCTAYNIGDIDKIEVFFKGIINYISVRHVEQILSYSFSYKFNRIGANEEIQLRTVGSSDGNLHLFSNVRKSMVGTVSPV